MLYYYNFCNVVAQYQIGQQCKLYEYSKVFKASCGVNGYLPTKYTNAIDAQMACDKMRKEHGNCSMILDTSCSANNNAGVQCYPRRSYDPMQHCSSNGFNSGSLYLCKEPVKVSDSTSSCLYFRGMRSVENMISLMAHHIIEEGNKIEFQP